MIAIAPPNAASDGNKEMAENEKILNDRKQNRINDTPNTSRPVVEHLGDGVFLLDGKKMTLDQLIMALEFKAVEVLEKQLETELENINKRNKLLEEANDVLSTVRVLKDTLDPDDDKDTATLSAEVKTFLKENGIEHNKDKCSITKDEIQTVIENVKAFIDSQNSRSQLDMTRISSILKKRDEALTIPANTNNNFHQTSQAIINKI